MADEEPESFIQQMTREVTLKLSAHGGRVFMQSADADDLERCTIELKCSWSPGLIAMLHQSIRIGDENHKPFKWDDDDVEVIDEEAEDEMGWGLYDCGIMLSVYRVDEKWLADSAAKNDDKPILGRLNYNPPIQTSDGVVNDQRPSVTAWVGLGHENFRLLRDRLLATDKPDFDLDIAVEFPRGTVESGWVKKTITWDGKGSLPVTNATLVWLRADWNSESARERRVPRHREPVHREPPPEHGELLRAMKKLEAAVVKLATPLWIAVGAAIVAAWLAR
jgi:hypothetical protein